MAVRSAHLRRLSLEVLEDRRLLSVDPFPAALEAEDLDAGFIVPGSGVLDAKQTGEIRGSKWRDRDGDDRWDAEEPGLGGWTIYLDLDHDGQWDDGEPRQVTGADGSYAFANLAPATYTVAEMHREGWRQTSPAPIRPVDVGSDGTPADFRRSYLPSINADGRYVAFDSYAANLVPADTNGEKDVFVSDRQALTIQRVSVASDGTQGNGDSVSASISADGRYVAFDSDASNLVPGDTNARTDTFVYDRQTDTIERVSVSCEGAESNGASGRASISADGRYVAFESAASNLVPDDTNGADDVFLYDRQTHTLRCASRAWDGSGSDGGCQRPFISADGRRVAFESEASNLVPDDSNSALDVFVYDRQTGTIDRVSVASDGLQGNSHSFSAAISADGRHVTFCSRASNLVPADTNGADDVFVYDRQTGTLRRVSVACDGSQGNHDSRHPSITADGRYVAFYSGASNLVPRDANRRNDVFIYDRQTGGLERLNVPRDGPQGDGHSFNSSISADGRYVAFEFKVSLGLFDPGATRSILVSRTPMAGPAGTRLVPLAAGQVVEHIDFGNREAAGEIRGIAWDDRDGDGARDPGEPGLAGATIYLDLDNSGQLDLRDQSTLTVTRGDDPTTPEDETGWYAITGLVQGTYTVAEVVSSHRGQTFPGPESGGTHTLDLAGDEIRRDLDFGSRQLRGEIHGGKWYDFDADGVWDTGEPALAGVTVYLDHNRSGTLDPGETSTTTDVDGTYCFTDLPSDIYVVGEVVPDGWQQTHPADHRGKATQWEDLGTELSTTGSTAPMYLPYETVDSTGGETGIPKTDLSGSLINMDRFRADPRFAGIDGSGFAAVILDTGIDPDHPFFGPDGDGDGTADRIVYQWDFADDDPDAGDVHGHGSNVSSIVASQDETYMGMAPGTNVISLKVFKDSGEGYFRFDEGALQWVVDNAANYHVASVNMSLGDGGNYAAPQALYGIDDELAALAAMGVIVVSSSGNGFPSYGGQQGVGYPSADPNSLSIGAVFDSEAGRIDYGSYTTAYTTGPDRIAPFSQRHRDMTTVFAPGAPVTGAGPDGDTITMHGTSQASPHVAGIAVLAQQLAVRHLGRRLSPAEFSSLLAYTAVTIRDGDDEDDDVLHTRLDFPRVDVLALAEGILALATPSNAHAVVVPPGRIVEGVDFGNRQISPLPGEIRGSAWHDLDGDGVGDPGEPGLAGWKTYLDENRNDRWDAEEPYRMTDPGGDYSFSDLPPGVYTVAEVPRPGWQQTAPTVELRQTRRVSLAWDSSYVDDPDFCTSISADGRFVAFEHQADSSLLVPADTNAHADVFVYDRQTDTTQRVSLAYDGAQGNAGSHDPSISADGRYVAFHSNASNLVPGDTNSAGDVFVYDRQTDTLQRVSLGCDGTQADSHSSWPSISADGRYVAFASAAANLVPGDTNGQRDVFVHDRPTGTTRRVSLARDGSQTNGDSYNPSISAEGRYVAFVSYASNLVSGDTNDLPDVFVCDRQTGTLEHASLASDGAGANGPSLRPAISADGRSVAFESYASNLVPGDTNDESDVFVYDLQTGGLQCVSVGCDGRPADGFSREPDISADGRSVVFHCTASNLVPGDTNGVWDVFLYDRQTDRLQRINLAQDASEADNHGISPAISADGHHVAFASSASNLVPGDNNGRDDVFVRTFGVVLPAPHTVTLMPGQVVPQVAFGHSRTTLPAEVVARHVFYNHSAFDGENPDANDDDDHAIAPDKQALLPGQTATLANYTSYHCGINGIMVDLAGLPDGVTLDENDFEFRVGNRHDPETWTQAPDPSSITVRPGGGREDSDRVTMIWPDNVIQKQWLQVTIPAGGKIGLAEADVFYFGNAVGESGNSAGDAKVNAYDMLAARDNQRSFLHPAPIDFPCDFNRDARVNTYDMLIARDNQTHFLNALSLIGVPPATRPFGGGLFQTTTDGSGLAGPKAPLVVSTSTDESDGDYTPGDLSLREALLLAAAQPGDDLIQFDGSLAGATILLDPALGHLKVESNVEIQGPGSEQLAIDGGGKTRVLFVAEGATASIHGLTVTGGAAHSVFDKTESWGGGIFNAGSLTGTDLTITRNVAKRYVNWDKPAIGSGGGIYNTGQLILSQTVISENSAEDIIDDKGKGGGGGGIYNDGGAVQLADVIISANHALYRYDKGNGLGGGICNADGMMELVRVTVSENWALLGGGIYSSGTLLATETTISANEAREGDISDGQGGGIYNAGTATLDSCLVLENEADDGDGGGIYSLGELTIADCTIRANFADDGDGGGVFNTGTATIRGSFISENEAEHGTVYNTGTLAIHDATISDNYSWGSGGGAHNAGTLTITNATISRNEAEDRGGGIYNSGTATVSHVAISGNIGFDFGGGGICNEGTMELANATISGNSAVDDGLRTPAVGGGLWSSGALTATNVTVFGNSAYQTGGGIFNDSGIATLHNTIIARNSLLSDSSYDDVAGAFEVASSYNLIGIIDGSTGLDGTGTLFGTAAAPLNPRLGPLKDNGGPTFTHAIWPDSPAIDAGSNPRAIDAGLGRDQRGFERFVDGDGDGTATVDVGAYEFEIDQVPPSATLASAGDIVHFGDTMQTFLVEYGDNLAVNVSSLDDSDVRVTGPAGYDEPARLLAVDFLADGSPRTATYQVPSAGVAWDESDNGTYEISLQADEVVDLGGNFAAAGVLGTFTVTIDDAVPSPVPLQQMEPPGSLVYARLVSGLVLAGAKGTDRFTVDLDQQQTFAVVADADPTLQPTIELLDPGGGLIGSAAAAAPGEDAVLGPVPVATAGTYTVAIAGISGTTGACTVRFVLNASVEAEEHDGPDNDDLASAEDLRGSFLSLGGSAARGAVLGRAGPSEDWYRFTLDDGQSASLLVMGEKLDALSLELYDADGNRLALAQPARNADQVIGNFVDATSDGGPDSYFARVSGPAAGDYNLVVMRNAAFDAEQNGTESTAQELVGNGVVLGHLGRQASGAGSVENVAASQSGGSLADASDVPPNTIPRDTQYVPGRLIVRFDEGAKDAARSRALATLGGKPVRDLPIIDGVVVELARPFGGTSLCPTDGKKADVPAEAARWSAHPAVLYAEPDYLVHALDTFPNDPDFAGLWGLHNTGQTGGTPDADLDAPEAWDIFTGSSTVVVASIDTGVDYTHEDLAANMWTNPGEIPGDMLDNDGNGYIDDVYGIDAGNGDSDPWDDHGHGTHTSGTIGAVGDNGVGVTGVNWDVRIMALKFLGSGGSGPTSDAVACVQYMTMMKTCYGVSVVASNNSWGGGGYSQALYDAIRASNEAGIMFVAAAANDASDNDHSPSYPNSYDLEGIISVAASDHNDHLADFSNYGATSVDLAAPGVDVLSTLPGNQYEAWQGTSMASPHVAGAVALMMAYKPRATLEEVKTATVEGVDPLPQFADITVSGGRLNLLGALRTLDDRADWYRVAVEAGDTLRIETATPGDGPYQFVNRLDPAIELYDPAGTLVADDDNSAPDGRNALLTHEAMIPGEYTVCVAADVDRGGEYVLKVTGHSGPLPVFGVRAMGPAAWDLRRTADPAHISIHFNDWVLLSCLDASDLTVDGVPATAVAMADGNTAVFQLPPTLVEGPNQVLIAAGALVDLQGTPVEPFSGTLWGIGDVITVNSALDERDGDFGFGDLSLREALALSKDMSGGHVIRFDDGLRGSTITLDPVLGPLRIGKDIDLRGLGPEQLTIDAAGGSRVFEVASGVTASISGLAMTGGNSNQAGGAIYNFGNLTITDAELFGNFSSEDGGAIFNYGYQATLTVRDATLSDNRAIRGGGAVSNLYGTAALANVTMSGNRAGRGGGAIYNWAGALTLADATISENSAVRGGGAIYNWVTGAVSILNSAISGNSAGRDGGAIDNSSAALTIVNTTIWENSTDMTVGGIYSVNGELSLANTTISGNLGSGVNTLGGTTTLDNVTIFANTASGPHGLIAEYGTAILHNTIVDDFYGTLDPASSHNLIGGDPGLGPLADNGGPAPTHALLPGSPAIDAGSNQRAMEAGLSRDGRGFHRFVDGDADGTATVDIGAYEFGATVPAEVVGRHVFYNRSTFDGDDPAANTGDDDAIAPDKAALLPGQTATFANYTSYGRGINGIMVDVERLAGVPTVDDFQFRVGNDNFPFGGGLCQTTTAGGAGWTTVAVPSSITVRPGDGIHGADRVTIIWDDNLIQKQWLQVTLLPGGKIGLAEADVFYFGNAIGESGNSAGDAKVNAYDMLAARDNQRTFLHPAPIDFGSDFNRDARVDAYDMLIARDNQTHFLNALKLITVPMVGKSPTQWAAASSPEKTGTDGWAWLHELESIRRENRRLQKDDPQIKAVDKLLAGDWR